MVVKLNSCGVKIRSSSSATSVVRSTWFIKNVSLLSGVASGIVSVTETVGGGVELSNVTVLAATVFHCCGMELFDDGDRDRRRARN